MHALGGVSILPGQDGSFGEVGAGDEDSLSVSEPEVDGAASGVV